MYVQDDVLLFDHLVRALCRNKFDMVQLLAEKVEQTEGNLTRFIKDRLMHLYSEVSNHEITKKAYFETSWIFTLTFGRYADGQYHLFTISAVFDLSQLTILINCTLSVSHNGFHWRPLKMRLRPLQFDKRCGQ